MAGEKRVSWKAPVEQWERTAEMNEVLAFLNPNKDTCYAQRKCAVCDGDAKEFSSPTAAREYAGSLMCEKCQDDAFGGHKWQDVARPVPGFPGEQTPMSQLEAFLTSIHLAEDKGDATKAVPVKGPVPWDPPSSLYRGL